MAELSQKTIAVLGSTGSVGTQSLDVARAGNMKVDYISGNSNLRLLEEQIREFHPRYCAVADEKNAKLLALSVADTDTKILSGADGVCEGIFLSGSTHSTAVTSQRPSRIRALISSNISGLYFSIIS